MATTHRFHPTLLREYDIRGIVGDTLHEADAAAIGRAFGSVVRRNGGRKSASATTAGSAPRRWPPPPARPCARPGSRCSTSAWARRR